MTPWILKYLCDPVTKDDLVLKDAVTDDSGLIISGELISSSGNIYPIINGIPRFTGSVSGDTVKSFGDEWNYFNFTDFKENWIQHTVANTFGTTDVFQNKIIVDAGGGSGSQTKWFLEYGASHVVMMDLSHSVDDVVSRNLAGHMNVDVIQCSIDAPPLKDGSIDGIVYCHNVIQHTPFVEKTAHALNALVAVGGEFVFNCYDLNDRGFFRWIRLHLIYKSLRYFLSRMPFQVVLTYSKIMGILRFIPVIGAILEKSFFCVQGDVPDVEGDSFVDKVYRRYKATVLNTYDCYGFHQYQHLKTDEEIQSLVHELQPDQGKVLNSECYFKRPRQIGCALRVFH